MQLIRRTAAAILTSACALAFTACGSAVPPAKFVGGNAAAIADAGPAQPIGPSGGSSALSPAPARVTSRSARAQRQAPAPAPA